MKEEGMRCAHAGFAGRIGVAREDITPPVGIYARNWGAARHETAGGIHRPLTATALVIQSSVPDTTVTLLCADLGWWRSAEDEAALRQGLLEEPGVKPEGLMIAFSHTHAGPALCCDDNDRPGGALIAPYLDSVQAAMRRAVRRARESSRPAILAWSRGRCDLACNRDFPEPGSSRLACGYNPAEPADDTLLVGRATAEDGRPLATLVNYACHPTTLAWENRLLSPDYVGAMRETVEAGTGGAPCLFMQGASGELAPREQYTGETAVADRHGRQLGYAVLSTLEGMLPPRAQLAYTGVVESGAPLAVWRAVEAEPSRVLRADCAEVEIPLKSAPPAEEIERELRACMEGWQAERLRRRLRIRRAVGDGSAARLPIWAWRIGDALLLGQPQEAYSLLQTELRRRFPDRAVVVMNLVNGPYLGYVPPASLYDCDLYQVWQTPFDRGSLERLLDASAGLLQRLTENSTQ